MTRQAARQFLDKVEKDAHFRENLNHAYLKGKAKQFLKENHLLFSKAEYKEAYQEKFHRNLTDEEMKKISAAREGKHGPRNSPSINLNLTFEDE